MELVLKRKWHHTREESAARVWDEGARGLDGEYPGGSLALEGGKGDMRGEREEEEGSYTSVISHYLLEH